jgi:hypothetical protein
MYCIDRKKQIIITIIIYTHINIFHHRCIWEPTPNAMTIVFYSKAKLYMSSMGSSAVPSFAPLLTVGPVPEMIL